MREETTQAVIERLLEHRSELSTREVADAARVSRQMAQKLLKALVDEGRLTVEGKARAARYKRARPERRRARVDDSVPERPSLWIADSLRSTEGNDDRRAAPVDDSPISPRGETTVDDARAAPDVVDFDGYPIAMAQVVDFREAAPVWDSGSPYTGLGYAPTRQAVLQVASAGSLYRLSARLLLADIDADEVILDFAGVMDVGEEFLEEIFKVWAQKHPHVRLQSINVPDTLRGRVAL